MNNENKDLVAHLVEQDRIETTPRGDEGGGRTRFIKTAVAEQVAGILGHCGRNGDFGVIVGPSGCGKTTSARAAAAGIPETVYLTMATHKASTLGVGKLLGQALNLPVGERPNQADLFDAAGVILHHSGRLLVVDEAHKLAGWRKDEALHALRDLQDATGIGMVWIGVPTLARYIQKGHSEGMETLDQIYSRVGIWLDLTDVAMEAGGDPGGNGAAACGGGMVTVEDVRRMLAARKLRFTAEAVRYLVALGREEGAGGVPDAGQGAELCRDGGTGRGSDGNHAPRHPGAAAGVAGSGESGKPYEFENAVESECGMSTGKITPEQVTLTQIAARAVGTWHGTAALVAVERGGGAVEQGS